MLSQDGLLQDIRSGRSKLAVWGLGYIGATTAAAYLATGASVVGVDPSDSRLGQIRQAALLHNTEAALATDLRGYLASGHLRLAAHAAEVDLSDVGCHFICVPTEASGDATPRIAAEVLGTIMDATPTVPIIIESTLSASWMTSRPFNGGNIIVAPRRDWFHSPNHTLQELTRICSASDADYLSFAASLLQVVCQSVVSSRDVMAAVTAKAFENSLWYLLFSYVNELAVAQSKLDLDEMLRLVKTNWRTPFTFQPAFQVGGYCLPLSYSYLSEFLGDDATALLASAAAANDRAINAVVSKLDQPYPCGSVLILGLTYRPGLPITTNSSGQKLAVACRDAGKTVLVHDPFIGEAKAAESLKVAYCGVPDGLDHAEAIIVCTDHQLYREIDATHHLEAAARLRVVIDCYGTLERYQPLFERKGIHYRKPGTRSW